MIHSINLWEVLAQVSNDDSSLAYRTNPVWTNGHVGEWIRMQELSLVVKDDCWIVNIHGCGEDDDNTKEVNLRVYKDGSLIVTRTQNGEVEQRAIS